MKKTKHTKKHRWRTVLPPWLAATGVKNWLTWPFFSRNPWTQSLLWPVPWSNTNGNTKKSSQTRRKHLKKPSDVCSIYTNMNIQAVYCTYLVFPSRFLHQSQALLHLARWRKRLWMDTHPQAGSPVKNELSKNRYPLRRSTTSSHVRGRTPKYHELPCCSGKLLVFAIDKPSHTQKCTTANCQRSEPKTPKGELQVLGNIGEHSLHHLILGFFGNTQKDRTEISYSTHSKLLSCVFSIVLFTIPYYTQISTRTHLD
jgi:hypothetical protein